MSKFDKLRMLIMQGVSGSGKSTFALTLASSDIEAWRIVSRDKIREKLLGKDGVEAYFAQGLDYSVEEEVTKREQLAIARVLASGKKVIIDNTNLKKKYVEQYIKLYMDICGNDPFGEIAMLKMLVTFDAALARINARGERFVSPEVLERQMDMMQSAKSWGLNDCIEKVMGEYIPKRWHLPTFEVLPDDTPDNKPLAIICDLDGTLAHRALLKDKDRYFYRSFYDYKASKTDDYDPIICDILHALYGLGYKILFVSGRKKSCEAETRSFLEKCPFQIEYELFMRDDNIDRTTGRDDPDDLVKYRLFNENIRNTYKVVGVFDDRKRVVALWEALGLKVLNVGSLNEEF